MTRISEFVRHFWTAIALVAVLSACTGAGNYTASPSTTVDSDIQPTGQSVDFQSAYRLGVGDKLRIIVFGEPDLTGEFDIDSTGVVAFPLIGQVGADGLTLREFERAVVAQLTEGYLRDPRVSAEVINFRPFTIIGEVNEPGEYPYRSGMNVLNAVAAAKGYSYRANQGWVFVTRAGEVSEKRLSVTHDASIYPGDIIRVPERFF